MPEIRGNKAKIQSSSVPEAGAVRAGRDLRAGRTARAVHADRPDLSGMTGKTARAPEERRRPGFGDTMAIVLGTFGVLLLISLGLSRLWPSGWPFLVAAGSFLYSTFSWASLYIPLWFGATAMLVRLPGFRPRSTFVLGASVVPFLIVAAYARLTTEPGAFFENHPVFAAVGLPAIYTGLGLLGGLALSLIAVGHFKITEWMKLNGMIFEKPSKRARKTDTRESPTRESHTRESADSGAGHPAGPFGRLAALFAGRRRNAADRLRTSEELAADPFEVRLPELPPRHDAAGEAASVATAIVPAVTGTAAGMAAGTASGTASATAAIEIASGSTIEFTSVPPQAALAGPDAHDAETARKNAVERILARKKEIPYTVPVDGILNSYPDGQYWIIDDKTRRNAEILAATLAEFNIQAEVTGIRKGPVITMFEILPAPGVRISKITNLSDNIALRLAASSVRIVAPIPGKHAVGIEVPNERRAIVSLREIVENEQFRSAKMEVPVALGKDIAGEVQFVDLTQMPHLLIAGATGSGKSVCVNAIILSILYRRSPEEVKLMLIDPKIVELKLYNDIPHLLTPVITEPKKAFQALQYCICEMERRYAILDKAGVRDIKSFNKRVKERNLAQEKLPYLVVIIDEFADLMATTGKELESTLARLAAMSRAVGIHLVLATQRPSIDVITGLIKANIPSRIAFMVAGKFDSRIIIDMVGAEKLLGRGDMLFSGAQDPFPVRIQGAYVSEEEVERAVAHVRTLGEPEYIDDEIFFDEEEEDLGPNLFDDGEGDPLFEKALEIVLQQGKASASFIQRRLKVGYNRAARLVELMEERGIVGPSQGSKPRDIVRNPEVLGRGDGPAGGAGFVRQKRDLMADPETVPNERVEGD